MCRMMESVMRTVLKMWVDIEVEDKCWDWFDVGFTLLTVWIAGRGILEDD